MMKKIDNSKGHQSILKQSIDDLEAVDRRPLPPLSAIVFSLTLNLGRMLKGEQSIVPLCLLLMNLEISIF